MPQCPLRKRPGDEPQSWIGGDSQLSDDARTQVCVSIGRGVRVKRTLGEVSDEGGSRSYQRCMHMICQSPVSLWGNQHQEIPVCNRACLYSSPPTFEFPTAVEQMPSPLGCVPQRINTRPPTSCRGDEGSASVGRNLPQGCRCMACQGR
jgi:hypothetical protein